MPAAIRVADDKCSAEELRSAARRCSDADAVRRMLALALLLEGHSRADAARAGGMDRQTLRDWVHRFNADGIAGLSNHWGGGRKPKLGQPQTDRLAELVRSGPDLAVHGVVRWRRIDLACVLQKEFDVSVNERTVGRLLRKLGFSRISVRPRHPGQDTDALQAHKKTLPSWSQPSCRPARLASRSSSGGRTKHASVSKAA
jgi:transposase